jgi:alpha-amylase
MIIQQIIKNSLLLSWFLFGGTAARAQATQPPGVCYEIFVRSFADSNGDGIGDINGITAKLDYLKELGIDAIWLTPVCKSPTYHKYDVEDYKAVDPEYGTLADLKNLIAEAHKRNIKVVKDLVVNHTSSRHPWFLEAQKGKDNPYRDYYVWLSPKAIDSLGIATREKSGDSWEVNPWHAATGPGGEKYYGLFWGGMPDLNFDNRKVRQEIYDIARFWLQEVGFDGFRLDAAKHIYPDWEAEKSQAFWVEFRKTVTAYKPDIYLVGEIWTTPDKVAPYFKGLPANFNIDASLAIQRILRDGEQSDLVAKLLDAYSEYGKVNPDFVDATITGNHDQLRIGTAVNGDLNKMKMAAALLLTLPGEPYLYYGEEIGMLGNKPDENIREPFLWKPKNEDRLRTSWMKPVFSTDEKVTNLETQRTDPHSLFNHYKKLLQLRHNQPALAQIVPANLLASGIQEADILSFVRPHSSGDLLVIHNISNQEKIVKLPPGYQNGSLIFQTDLAALNAGTLKIPPFGTVVIR